MLTLPLAVQTAYQDLFETHKMRTISSLGGTPFLKSHDVQGSYRHARKRIGDRVLDWYLGRDTQEIRIRIDQAREDREDEKMLERRRAIANAAR